MFSQVAKLEAQEFILNALNGNQKTPLGSTQKQFSSVKPSSPRTKFM